MRTIAGFAGSAAKAIYASGAAFIASLGTVLVGNESISQVSDGQWVFIAGATLGAFGAVYGVTNTPTIKTAPHGGLPE